MAGEEKQHPEQDATPERNHVSHHIDHGESLEVVQVVGEVRDSEDGPRDADGASGGQPLSEDRVDGGCSDGEVERTDIPDQVFVVGAVDGYPHQTQTGEGGVERLGKGYGPDPDEEPEGSADGQHDAARNGVHTYYDEVASQFVRSDEKVLLDERRHLLNLAFRMLGTFADAEDAVQETYARWYRLTDDERAEVSNPAAWLTRVASRVCLDALKSARARREQYVGEWLPEPVPEQSGDPLDRVTLDDTVSTALLIVLDTLTPAERVAFVLHDVFAMPFTDIAEVVGRSADACRQLATSARRRIRERRPEPVTRENHDAVVRAFADACRNGDLATLAAILDPDVVLRSDGGGFVSAARNPVMGASNVGRFLLGIVAKQLDLDVEESQTADGTALTFWRDGRIGGVVTLRVVGETVADVWIMMNPEKLSLWR